MARVCDRLAVNSGKSQSFHRARVIDLWSLFPVFCKDPVDIEESLAPLGTTLGRAIQDKRYPELLVSLFMVFVDLPRVVVDVV